MSHFALSVAVAAALGLSTSANAAGDHYPWRNHEVPFSHLWKRVLEQKDANALWKQLKRLISLILILLILGIMLFAEPANAGRLACIAIIVCGVAGLKAFS